jgi:methylglutaconyl-CoA hydratase
MAKIETNIQDEILNINLTRPDVHNAMDTEMIGKLTEAFVMPSLNSSIRAVFLRGDGKSFCAGADLEYMRSMAKFSFEENQRDAEALFLMFDAGLRCPVPIFAHVHGSVMGGAIGLVAISDFATAELSTRFCFSEVKIGLVPAVICPFVFKKMKIAAGREFMLTGRNFSALEALNAELIQFIGSEAECRDKVMENLNFVKQAGPEAVRETKSLIAKVRDCQDWSEIKKMTTQVIAEKRVGLEGQEGIRSFFERRLPKWQLKKT